MGGGAAGAPSATPSPRPIAAMASTASFSSVAGQSGDGHVAEREAKGEQHWKKLSRAAKADAKKMYARVQRATRR